MSVIRAPLYFSDYRTVPDAVWPYRNFNPAEIACHGSNAILINHDALAALDAARDEVGLPFYINSAYRSPVWNAREGGAPLSFHLKGEAFDIRLAGHDIVKLVAVLRKHGFRGFGFYNSFVHADRGPPRAWGLSKWKSLASS